MGEGKEGHKSSVSHSPLHFRPNRFEPLSTQAFRQMTLLGFYPLLTAFMVAGVLYFMIFAERPRVRSEHLSPRARYLLSQMQSLRNFFLPTPWATSPHVQSSLFVFWPGLKECIRSRVSFTRGTVLVCAWMVGCVQFHHLYSSCVVCVCVCVRTCVCVPFPLGNSQQRVLCIAIPIHSLRRCSRDVGRRHDRDRLGHARACLVHRPDPSVPPGRSRHPPKHVSAAPQVMRLPAKKNPLLLIISATFEQYLSFLCVSLFLSLFLSCQPRGAQARVSLRVQVLAWLWHRADLAAPRDMVAHSSSRLAPSVCSLVLR